MEQEKHLYLNHWERKPRNRVFFCVRHLELLFVMWHFLTVILRVNMVTEDKTMSEFEFVYLYLAASVKIRNQVAAISKCSQWSAEPAQEPEDISDIKSRPVRERHLNPSP